MEKAILKTLIYADIFDYPLKAYEIHKWLIGKKVSLRQVEKSLKKLQDKKRVISQRGYYFLPKRFELVNKRKQSEKQSAIYLKKAQLLANLLKIIPTLRLVGISGGLAMENAQKKDDIDLFIITMKNRLWLSRLLALGLLSMIGQRRKPDQSAKLIAGKLCLNILLEEDRLAQFKRDIYLAHEVLQMKVLWQRDGLYSKYLTDNEWVFKFLPNWTSGQNVQGKMYNVKNKKQNNSKLYIVNSTFDLLERLSRKFQLWYMKKPQGLERIQDGALYFHPQDIRPQVLKEYRMRVRNF